jgi:surface protein
MGTTADKLLYLQQTKAALKTALEQKGVPVPAGTSFRNYADKLTELVADGPVTPQPWIRPADWLPMPTIAPTEQKIVGLFGVYDDQSNYVAFTASGNYTVDWGDGTTNNYTAGSTAQKLYTYSSIPFSTESTRGYRQVFITITPQAGANLTIFNLSVLDSTGRKSSIPWLDLQINTPNITGSNLTIVNTAGSIWLQHLERVNISAIGTLTNTSNMFMHCQALQEVSLFNTASVTSMPNMFLNCYSLQTIPAFNTVSVNNMATMFTNCYSLKKVPTLNCSMVASLEQTFRNCSSLQEVTLTNTQKVTNTFMMFSGCNSLRKAPLFDTSAVTTTSQMFGGCISLRTIPLYDTVKVNNMNSMFSGCNSLEGVPLLNTSNVTNMSNMFQNCVSLKVVPLFDTSKVTNMAYMFNSCQSLKTTPLFNTSLVTSMVEMFRNCFSLVELPLFNTVSVTSMYGMFWDCLTLQKLPVFNTTNVTNLGYGLYFCRSLTEIPEWDIINVTPTGLGNAFQNNPPFRRCRLKNIKSSINLWSGKLSRAEILEIFNNLLPTTGQTITIGGNYGATSLTAADRDIAINKGWTISG